MPLFYIYKVYIQYTHNTPPNIPKIVKQTPKNTFCRGAPIQNTYSNDYITVCYSVISGSY